MNFTSVVLIPKVDNAVNIGDFRPISLCKVLYRILSETIANRLKFFMDKLTSPQQSAFISGRLITDNVMIAYEIHHHMSCLGENRRRYASVKLDMSMLMIVSSDAI